MRKLQRRGEPRMARNEHYRIHPSMTARRSMLLPHAHRRGSEHVLEVARGGASSAPVVPAEFIQHQGCFFGNVRIHADRHAAELARTLGARAFTLGNDIYFGRNQYRPHTGDGRRLLFHELTHVVQQHAGAASGTATIGAPDSSAEREASAVADAVSRGEHAPPISQSVPATTIQRQPVDDMTVPPPTPVQQFPWSPTDPGTFSIFVESDKAKPASCVGDASSGVAPSPLSACGMIEHFCTSPASYPLKVSFFIDAQNMERPQPFTPPTVSVALSFVPDGATAPNFTRSVTDPAPRYQSAGHPLMPSFGTTFNVSSNGSGQLGARFDMVDPGTGIHVTYVDRIRCNLSPCA
jgi:hypothetical protein